MRQVYVWLKRIWVDPKFRGIRDVFWFVVITLVIHYSYRFWDNELAYWPVNGVITGFQRFMVHVVFDQSTFIDLHVLGIDLNKEGTTMIFANGEGIRISEGCSGDKQLLQLAILLLVFPGKWFPKLWIIPVGLVLVHSTNILRIVLLSLVAIWKPEWMTAAHDTVLRGIFYVVIFGVWLLFIRFARK